jgi:hypothetical protein
MTFSGDTFAKTLFSFLAISLNNVEAWNLSNTAFEEVIIDKSSPDLL